jgi:hypothetical protein
MDTLRCFRVASKEGILGTRLASGALIFTVSKVKHSEFIFMQHAAYEIHTNNYVESWHYQLKFVYLKFMRRQRVDVVVHVLVDRVEPDLWQQSIRVDLNFERARLSQQETASYQRSRKISVTTFRVT